MIRKQSQRKSQRKASRKAQRKAFSLIELSIVILIISILITGSLGVSKTAINNSKTKITKERMDEIYSALTNFVAKNRRLPCPAIPTDVKGNATYGAETAIPSTCSSSLTSSFSTSPVSAANLVYGMVPLQALGLDPDVVEDGWGTKFSYIVDKRFTRKNTSTTDTVDGFEITKGNKADDGVAIAPTLMEVQGPSGTPLVPDLNAVMVLISYGANKFYGYDATGTSQNGASAVTDEISNGYNSTTMDARFINYSTDANFDDFVLFKTKSQLVRDSGLEFMICSGLEAATSTNNWGTTLATSNNVAYSCGACSDSAINIRRTCGKYGVWGGVNSTTCSVGVIACP